MTALAIGWRWSRAGSNARRVPWARLGQAVSASSQGVADQPERALDLCSIADAGWSRSSQRSDRDPPRPARRWCGRVMPKSRRWGRTTSSREPAIPASAGRSQCETRADRRAVRRWTPPWSPPCPAACSAPGWRASYARSSRAANSSLTSAAAWISRPPSKVSCDRTCPGSLIATQQTVQVTSQDPRSACAPSAGDPGRPAGRCSRPQWCSPPARRPRSAPAAAARVPAVAGEAAVERREDAQPRVGD